MKTILTILFSLSFLVANENPQIKEFLNTLKSEVQKTEPSFKEFSAQRGEEIFTSKHIGKKGKEVSCTSCHTKDLTTTGENEKTGKKIEPMAPSANSESLTDIKNVKKWLRRNFKDVYSRVGTAKEKGDVITFILSK